MLEKVNRVLYGLPFGVPLGWIAARIFDGDYELAFREVMISLPLVFVWLIFNRSKWGFLGEARRAQGE